MSRSSRYGHYYDEHTAEYKRLTKPLGGPGAPPVPLCPTCTGFASIPGTVLIQRDPPLREPCPDAFHDQP